MSVSESVIVIPALNPGDSLPNIISELQTAGFERIIIVNDGSDPAYEEIFVQAKDLGCEICTHDMNLGKGAALKTGIAAAVDLYGNNINIITVDSDGQHKVGDIVKVRDAVIFNPDKLVLGVRDFSGADVPFKSRFGNTLTSRVFKITTGRKCPDTQTGLRGIPSSLISFALDTEGTRYEYEMNFLTAAAGKVEFCNVPIETIYEDGNKSSHFRPVRDSIRVYGCFLRFIVTSLSSFAVDYALFYWLLKFLKRARVHHQSRRIMIATIIARIISGIINFTLNKKFAFKSKGNTAVESIKYLILFLCQMGASALFTAMLSTVLPAVVAKIIVDTALFFVSFITQKRLVFKGPDVIQLGKGAGL